MLFLIVYFHLYAVAMSLTRCPINFYLISAVTQTVKTVEESKGTSQEKEMKKLEMLGWRKEDSRSDMRAVPNYLKVQRGVSQLILPGIRGRSFKERQFSNSSRDDFLIGLLTMKKLPQEKINSHTMATLKHRLLGYRVEMPSRNVKHRTRSWTKC